MPVTVLDPTTALIIVDLQIALVGLPAVHRAEEVVARAAALAAAFRRRALPVVLVNVAGGAPGRTDGGRGPDTLPPEWTALVPALEIQASDIRITKRTWGAFTHTDLEAALRARGTTQVVVCGMTTSIGVESTARHAYDLGFHVSIPVDATTDLDADAHDHSVRRIFPRLGETGRADDIIAALPPVR